MPLFCRFDSARISLILGLAVRVIGTLLSLTQPQGSSYTLLTAVCVVSKRDSMRPETNCSLQAL